MNAKYINPYTDFGFKKIFGEESNKDLLQNFLNSLLAEKYQIKELSFKNPENLADVYDERKAIFDIYCEGENGDKFIVEMQKAKINYFKDRAVFYTTFPIREQAEKGIWDFKLKPVFCVAILDFVFDDEIRKHKDYLSKVQLRDEYCEVFYDKLTYIFIEMPRFNKTESELENNFDKWLYFLKNLEDFNEIPQILNEPIFKKGFEIAEMANLNEKQRASYEGSLKVYWDSHAIIDTAKDEGIEIGIGIGREEGKLEGKIEVARNCILQGLDNETIVKLTGLSLKQTENLRLKI
jgi:predicted transposase/invertase (TIGR01784 family)